MVYIMVYTQMYSTVYTLQFGNSSSNTMIPQINSTESKILKEF